MQVLSRMGCAAEAEAELSQALGTSRENLPPIKADGAGAEGPLALTAADGDRLVSYQFALLNLGEHALRVGDRKRAAALLAESLVATPVCDMAAISRGLRNLEQLFANDSARLALLENTAQFVGSAARVRKSEKDLVLCLDYSGSMAGLRVK